MKEITAKGRALQVHNRILFSANLVAQSLWDMATGLKEMRDDKLYRELGYGNFEEYCKTEFNFSRRQGYYYISIAEKMDKNFVKSTSQIGVQKLYLLSTLTEENQQKIVESTDLESTTYKELEQKVRELKGKNKMLEQNLDIKKSQVQSLQARLDDTGDALRRTSAEKNRFEQENSELKAEIKELESRPLEVAPAPSASIKTQSEFDRALAAIERETYKQQEELELEYEEHEKTFREHLTQKKNEEIEKLKAEYEDKLRSQAVQPVNSTRAKFDALFQLCEAEIDSLFLTALKDETGKVHYQDQFNKLINTIKEKQEAI